MNEPNNREVVIYNEVLLLPAGERAAYLAQACAEDTELRRRIESLIEVHDRAGNLFEALEHETKTSRSTTMAAMAPGETIGRYTLLEQIGEGGCGIVYRAEQSAPVQRQVALKVIKLGMDTRQVVARFEAERQVLALMDHPSIARVFDAGATDLGRPYFVMELVRGVKITDYCDRHRLSTADRLKLFIQVCRAIQHAHQKGVIHRDIKPSNILVSVTDGAPFPKVIDFGIAKATQGRMTKHTSFTAFEQFIGTPAYVSPEQAEISSIDIDTRSDIYSLGVLLYELLTSRTPFESKELLTVGLDAMRRAIREKEPPRPSTRLGMLKSEDLAIVAKHRHAEPPKLIHLVRGDLDWIVMRAMEKDRARRYETVNALVRDIERHLANEPVAARPTSQLDRFRKVVRRNRLAFAAGAAVLAALVLGFGVSTWLFLREKDARRLALAAKEEQEQLRHLAEMEAGKSRHTAEFLEDVLNRFGSAVSGTQGRTQLREMLDRVTPADEKRPQSMALLRMRASLRGNQGRFAEASTDLARLLQINPDDTELWHWQAAVLAYLDRPVAYRDHCRLAVTRFKETQDPVAAERIAKDALILPSTDVDPEAIDRMVDTAVGVGPTHPDLPWLQLAKGLAEHRRHRFPGALDWLYKIELGHNPPRDAQTLLVLAMAEHASQHPSEAREAFDKAVAIINHDLAKLESGDLGGWVDWMIAHTLLREASAVVREKP